jgi:hypothetical protein
LGDIGIDGMLAFVPPFSGFFPALFVFIFQICSVLSLGACVGRLRDRRQAEAWMTLRGRVFEMCTIWNHVKPVNYVCVHMSISMCVIERFFELWGLIHFV